MPSKWWGKYDVPQDEIRKWRIGPTTLWICRRLSEWQISTETNDDPFDRSMENCVPAQRIEAGPEAQSSRYGFLATTKHIDLLPALADRPIVTSPETLLYLASGEEITLYFSTPLWIKLRSGDPLKELCDMPLFKPSDTWFGPSTIEGEMCYATRSSARTTVPDLTLRPHRAYTSVLCRNQGTGKLGLSRLKVPVVHLSLYANEEGQLWTETLTLNREEDEELAAVQVGAAPPPESGATALVSDPRKQMPERLITRAFGAIFR
ncbi:hypothetical protein ACFLU6_14260 [Acidobacteriota bacterium]